MRSSRWALFLLISCDSSEHLPASSPVVASDSLAADIERAVPTLRRDTATVLELSTEGATLDAAYHDATLQRLRVVYLGEMGRATETFYFDSSLFLVVRGEVRYDVPLSGHVAESSTMRVDLRAHSTPQRVRDSLLTDARALLGHLASARKP